MNILTGPAGGSRRAPRVPLILIRPWLRPADKPLITGLGRDFRQVIELPVRFTPVAVVEVGRKNVFVMRRRAQYSFVGRHRASSGNKYKRMTPTIQMGTNGRDPITASE